MKKTNQGHYVEQEYAPRRSVSITYGSVSGIYPFRNSSGVRFESLLERDFLVRLETMPYVLSVVSQPLTLKYKSYNGVERPYTPDFLVNFKGPPYSFRKSQLIEVKPIKALKKDFREWKPKFKKAFEYCKNNDLIFHFMDESKIKDQRWNNATFLKRYLKRSFDSELTNLIIESVEESGSIEFEQLLDKHFWTADTKAVGISHIWNLVAEGKLACNMSIPLNRYTEVWVPEYV